MNIQQLRYSLKVKWLLYYRQNRPWLTKLRIWGTFEGQRRPSSSFILATVSNLEPQLTQMLPFIVDLSSNPDQIINALGLNFNPEEELKSLTEASLVTEVNAQGNGLSLMAETNTNGNGFSKSTAFHSKSKVNASPVSQASTLPSWVDESCSGIG